MYKGKERVILQTTIANQQMNPMCGKITMDGLFIENDR